MEIHRVLRSSHPHIEMYGAHQLAWSVILDSIFADAYHAGVREMTVCLSDPTLHEWVQLRASATSPKGNLRAIICEGFDMMADNVYDRAYTIEHGGVLGGAIQKRQIVSENAWAARQQAWVYTWRARIAGIPIRLANLSGRPHVVDICMQRMRAVFVSRKPTISYYHTTVWERVAR